MLYLYVFIYTVCIRYRIYSRNCVSFEKHNFRQLNILCVSKLSKTKLTTAIPLRFKLNHNTTISSISINNSFYTFRRSVYINASIVNAPNLVYYARPRHANQDITKDFRYWIQTHRQLNLLCMNELHLHNIRHGVLLTWLL